MTDGSDRNNLPLIASKVADHEVLNRHLKELLVMMSSSVPDQVSNQLSQRSYFEHKWLSQPRLHENKDENIQTLVRFVENTANRKVKASSNNRVLSIKTMWSIVSKPGLVGERHNHAGQVSAAYYVDAGSSGENEGGLLQFYLNRQSTQPSHFVVPEAGVLYLFPSNLEHSVSRYVGKTPRIVISINLTEGSHAGIR